jgi:hypothetical protein
MTTVAESDIVTVEGVAYEKLDRDGCLVWSQIASHFECNMTLFNSYRMNNDMLVGASSISNANYVLADGYFLGAFTLPAYCRDCDAICPSESFPSLSIIESWFTGAHRFTLKSINLPDSEPYREAIAAMRRVDWRRTREAPPRCLRCNRHNLFVIESNNAHDPITGNTFIHHQSEMYNELVPTVVRLNPDGTIIASNLGQIYRLPWNPASVE